VRRGIREGRGEESLEKGEVVSHHKQRGIELYDLRMKKKKKKKRPRSNYKPPTKPCRLGGKNIHVLLRTCTI